MLFKTLKDVEEFGGEVLTCAQIAPLLKANPATLHAQAMYEPDGLGFPVIIAKRRVKIPRRPFIKFMKGEPV